MNSRPRILIGVPCYGNVVPEVLEDWMRLMYHCGRRLPDYDFFLGIRTKTEQFRARQSIVEEGQKINADYLLFLDDDMIINPLVKVNATPDYGFIEKLIAHDKDIVGALYYQRTGACLPVAMVESGERGYRFLHPHEVEGKLQPVDVAGGGALLIKMSVFDRLPHPYFAPEHEYGTDVQLCRAAKAKGISVWLDSSIELGHVSDQRVIITSQNRGQYAMETSTPGELKEKMMFNDIYQSLIEDAKDYTGIDSVEKMARVGQQFMTHENKAKTTDLASWYREFPMERVARQVWFNTANGNKRKMTEFILQAIGDQIKTEVLDFGCGIGITAFELARRGHRVTACDIAGTGTLEFLQWRIKQNAVSMTINKSLGGVPVLGGSKFGAIIAMDCLEHIPEWKRALEVLSDHLLPGGILFCNNGILDDQTHPEHIDLRPKEFTKYCIDLGLMPYNQIMFQKVEQPVTA